MSYDKKILREFIRAKINSPLLSEKLQSSRRGGVSPEGQSMGGMPGVTGKRMPTYAETWGFERADATTHPWMNMLSLSAPAADLYDSFFGEGGWLTPELGGFTALGNKVASMLNTSTTGHRGQGVQQRTASLFPRSTGILSGPGNYVTSFGAPTANSFFADSSASAAAGRPVTSLGVPVRENVEQETVETVGDIIDQAEEPSPGDRLAFARFSAAVNQDLSSLVDSVHQIQGSPDIVTAIERFNNLMGDPRSLYDVRREFDTATPEDLDKPGMLNKFANDTVPNFIAHVMDTSVQDMVSNLSFTPQQQSEIETLLTQAKIKL
tara:strand:+ start:1115 stop:2080 length:966 start_codon:yes stop_codon:yes gene_type:complete